jgi:hypothetical protein
MRIIEWLRAVVGRQELVDVAHDEDLRDPTDRPRSDQENFEEVKDDDVLARGSTLAGPTLGPGTAGGLRDEFESDQQSPRDLTP